MLTRLRCYLTRKREYAGLWLNDHLRTRWYDRVVARGLRPREGQGAPSDRVTIMAVYPDRGIRPTHLRALRYLHGQGYAVLLVSNLPLSAPDIAAIRPFVWRYATRPNFGYDIGAYRAAVLWLDAQPGGLARLKRLVLTNDSIWWPLKGAEPDWLAEAERLENEAAAQGLAAPALLGAICNYDVDLVPLGEAHPWIYDGSQRRFHYCSFALSIGPAILSDSEFLAFWQRLRLINHKIQMVLRSEVGLSQWALSRGHSHACCWDVAGLPDRLNAFSHDELLRLLGEVVIPEDNELREARDQLLAQQEATPNKAALVDALLLMIARTGPAYALPAVIAREAGTGFIKVSPLRLEPAGRAATLKTLADDPELLEEARQIPLRRQS